MKKLFLTCSLLFLLTTVFANSEVKSKRKVSLKEPKIEVRMTGSLLGLKRSLAKKNVLMTCFGSSCGAVVCDRSNRRYSNREAIRMLEWIEDACANGEFS